MPEPCLLNFCPNYLEASAEHSAEHGQGQLMCAEWSEPRGADAPLSQQDDWRPDSVGVETFCGYMDKPLGFSKDYTILSQLPYFLFILSIRLKFN